VKVTRPAPPTPGCDASKDEHVNGQGFNRQFNENFNKQFG
jgi:hypothetical protein